MAFRTNKMPVLQEKSASGAVASFNTALAMPLSSCTSLISGYQEGSGTPSPDNVRPINGYSAINIANASEDLYHDITVQNGYLDIYGNVQASGVSSVTDYIPVVEGLVYYYYDYVTASLGPRNICIYDDSKQFVSCISYETVNKKAYFSIPSNGAYVRITIDRNYTNQHLYNGTTTTIQIGSTVYGGEYDARTGLLTCNWAKADTSIMIWGKSQSGLFVSYSLAGIIKNHTLPYIPSPYIKCSVFECVDTSGITGPQGDTPSPNGVFAENTGGAVYFNLTSETTIEGFKAFMSDKQFIYELAEPIEIPLGGINLLTQEGQNNIFADCGDIDLTYKDLDIAKRGNFREVFRLPS